MGLRGPATRQVPVDETTRLRVLSALAAGATREQVAADEHLDYGCVMRLAAAGGWPSRPRLADAAAGIHPVRLAPAAAPSACPGSVLGRVSLSALVTAAFASRRAHTRELAREAVMVAHRLAHAVAADASIPELTRRRAARGLPAVLRGRG